MRMIVRGIRSIKNSFLVLLFVVNVHVFAQVGQLGINRVSLMPNLPSPFLMRDWKDVALKYDQLIFSSTATGQHLPLLSLKTTGVNYPELSPILLQTYVGTASTNQAEAINIIPAVVSASLVGIDKSNQAGVNWTEKTKDFFNKKNEQNVYLNSYSTESGGDWWYDVMPNIFFFQLYTHYPETSDFDLQFISVADRWLAAVHAMGGSTTPWTVPQMNYRAWNLMTMTGNSNGVKEPEAAGGIGWLLYNAYQRTGEKKYLEGAQMSVEFLSNWNSNPSYELQLPYGAFIAAKMNAELGTSYDLPKLINWCFDRGSLRGWGAIKGKWNGVDVDGLIGEANDVGNDYAFIMNGFQQAAALVPLIKYDKRFARDIAKWTLNVANASRLFYSQYLPAASQDDFTWSSTHDPNSVIAYEALKQVWEGKPLYGTGDAKRSSWAQTNLALYGSSHVGYLAAVVETTDVEGILLLNVNKTDFFNAESYPSFVLYNPYPTNKLVTINLPSGSHDIYDAISETTIATGVNGNVSITVKADEAMLLVYIPAGSSLLLSDGKLYVNNKVIDYHYGYDFTGLLRIKSLAVTDTLVAFNQQVPVFTTVDNAISAVTYTWMVDNVILDTFTDNTYTWTVPETTGRVVLKLQIESAGKTALDSIVFNVVETISVPPVIQSILSDKRWYAIGSRVVLTCNATDEIQTPAELVYQWSVPSGAIISENGAILTWQPPATEGIYEITCEVTDQDLLTTVGKKLILIKQLSAGTTPTFAYYPFDGDVQDYSGNEYHALKVGVDAAADARGEPDKAYRFDSGSDIIYVTNNSALNFQDKITLSFWIKLSGLTEESFILSHGSWEQRWKVSVTPNSLLRWTVKTSTGIKDLDSSFPLALNQFYHFTVVYSGYSMELYADGELNKFSAHSGLIATTNKSLTFGRKEEGVSNYFLRGTLDEVRIYNAVVAPDEISTLKTIWHVVTGTEDIEKSISIYPNPSSRIIHVMNLRQPVTQVDLIDITGRKINCSYSTTVEGILRVEFNKTAPGIIILKIETDRGLTYHKLMAE